MYNYGRIYWPFCQGGVKNACSFKTWSGAMTRLGASGSATNNNARRDETQALRPTPVRSQTCRGRVLGEPYALSDRRARAREVAHWTSRRFGRKRAER